MPTRRRLSRGETLLAAKHLRAWVHAWLHAGCGWCMRSRRAEGCAGCRRHGIWQPPLRSHRLRTACPACAFICPQDRGPTHTILAPGTGLPAVRFRSTLCETCSASPPRWHHAPLLRRRPNPAQQPDVRAVCRTRAAAPPWSSASGKSSCNTPPPPPPEAPGSRPAPAPPASPVMMTAPT